MGEHANCGLLRIARQLKGFSQGEASRALLIPQVALSRYENKVASPSEELIERASRIYDLPVSFFYQPDVTYGAPVSVHPMWRKKHDVTSHELDSIIAEMNLRTMHIKRLMNSVDIAPKRDIPRIDLDRYDGDMERVASLVRAHWLVPSGPITDLTAIAELAGCIVIHSTMNGSSVSGMTVSIPGMPPIIMLNQDQPADRMRFTLAHEIGHLILHKFPNPEMEQEANAFASAFLMPANDMKIALSGRIDLRRLAALKPEWRVSMQGLLYRAQSLNLIGKREAGWLWRQFSSLRIKLREPPELDFPIEMPSVLSKMIQLHLDAFGYSIDELSGLFHVFPHTLVELYPSAGGQQKKTAKLRIVQ